LWRYNTYTPETQDMTFCTLARNPDEEIHKEIQVQLSCIYSEKYAKEKSQMLAAGRESFSASS